MSQKKTKNGPTDLLKICPKFAQNCSKLLKIAPKNLLKIAQNCSKLLKNALLRHFETIGAFFCVIDVE